MPKFIAMTSRGLVDVLEDEIRILNTKNLKRIPGGVEFESNWATAYEANLWLRTANRVVMPVLDFPAYQPEDIYHNTMKHDFTKYISADSTLAIDASVRESKLTDQRYVALKTKDAIVDQFNERFGRRPDVDTSRPQLKIHCRVVKNQVSLAVDLSGESLFKRGYRKQTGLAPLKETIAAALVKMSGWERNVPIVDPMCGSGTILIEAALILKNTAPGLLRKRFAFQNFLNFDPTVWQELVNKAIDTEVEDSDFQLYGYDISDRAIDAAKENARAAGVDHLIHFEKKSINELRSPVSEGLLISNPPYGERLDVQVEDLYKDLSFLLKKEFAGWDAWLLSGNKDLTQVLKLKSSRKFQLFNGPIECRFLNYKVFA